MGNAGEAPERIWAEVFKTDEGTGRRYTVAGDTPLDEARPGESIPYVRDDGWQPIESAPKDGTAVLVYFGNRTFHDGNGGRVSLGDPRDHVERTAVGFYEQGEWCDQGTGHDMFEEWRGDFPTHWRPLPAPPSTPEPCRRQAG